MKRKKGSRSWYYYHLIEKAKKIAKLRDGYVCQRCGVTESTHQIHGSHVVGVKMGTQFLGGLSADINNIKALCFQCHSWYGLNPLESGKWFREKYPLRTQYIENYDQTRIWSMEELEEMHKLYTEILKNPERIKELSVDPKVDSAFA